MNFQLPKPRLVWSIAGVYCLSEVLSFTGFLQPTVGLVAFCLIAFGAAVITWRSLDNGLLVLLAELFVGGKGYLYSLEVGQVTVSIRHALFVIVGLIWLVKSAAGRVRPLLPAVLSRWLVALAAVVALGVVIGLIRGNHPRDIFFDANAFLFYLLVLVLAWPKLDWPRFVTKLLAVVAAAAVVLGLKSLVVLGIFVHWRIDGLVAVYRWIRNTGVGEIAPIFGGTYRVFFQSQVYGLLAVALLTPWLLPRIRPSDRWPRWLLVPVTLALASVMVSLSRSFWLGGSLAVVGAGVVVWRRYHWATREWVSVGVASALVLFAAYTLNSWALNFPYPYPLPGAPGRGDAIRERLTTISGEAAVSSRQQQFRALLPAIEQHPLFGSGFGTAVTYRSQDPRQTQLPSQGIYTTYAFELAYLDLALKVGLVGLLVYLGLLATTLRQLVRSINPLTFGLAVGLVALLGVHLTTPYLNHPLGIGFVLLAFAAIARLPAVGHRP
ncbi:MAG: O-antigen ligase family protein [Candidatus Kerfeldbacteria bacterium]|nr:O-antigen ligase family protein [Candidatus Kerfeldbacteria bacterium]